MSNEKCQSSAERPVIAGRRVKHGKSESNSEHVICHDATKGQNAYMLECLNCGGIQRFSVPISITVYVAAAKAFEKMHKKCKPRA